MAVQAAMAAAVKIQNKQEFTMNRLVMFSLLVLSWTAVASDVVYLDCRTFNEPSGKWTKYELTLRESSQTVVFTSSSIVSKGRSYTRPAQFTQTEVLFSWAEPTFGLEFAYHIDRTNLEFSEKSVSGTGIVNKGECSIKEPVDRKF